jgi:hypothetical protein
VRFKLLKPRRHFTDGWPACTTEKQYELWKESAGYGGRGLPQSGFCTDCTPEYQREMVSQGRCEHPTISFRIDQHGFVEGYFASTNDD